MSRKNELRKLRHSLERKAREGWARKVDEDRDALDLAYREHVEQWHARLGERVEWQQDII